MLHSRRTQSTIYCYDLRGTSELREHSLGEIMKGLKGKIVYERDLQRAKSIDIQVALCARMLTLHCISLCKWQRDQRVNKNQRETRKICPMSPSTAALEDRASCIGGEEVRGPRCISITGQLPLLRKQIRIQLEQNLTESCSFMLGRFPKRAQRGKIPISDKLRWQ